MEATGAHSGRRNSGSASGQRRQARQSRRLSHEIPQYAFGPLLTHDPSALLPPHVIKYAAVREKSIVMPWVCRTCNAWTERGSYAMRACSRCGTPRPANL